jgi:hypothetical protein
LDEINQLTQFEHTGGWVGILVVAISLTIGLPFTISSYIKPSKSRSYEDSSETARHNKPDLPPRGLTTNSATAHAIFKMLRRIVRSIYLAIPAYFLVGGWAVPLISALFGTLIGWFAGNFRIGWIVGVFVGVFGWFCGYPVYRSVQCLGSRLGMLIFGSLLGSTMGALTLSMAWVVLCHLERIQYRSDTRPLLTLFGATFGLIVGLVASAIRCFGN